MIGPCCLILSMVASDPVPPFPGPSQPYGTYVPLRATDVQLKVEALGPAPLPLQAVRLRLTLKNISKKTTGPVWPVDNHCPVEVKGPEDSEFREVEKARLILHKGRPRALTTRESKNLNALNKLEPQEEMSATFAVAADWGGGGWFDPEKAKPVFPAPGKYTFKVIYQRKSKEEDEIAQTVVIQVREPEGDNKAVYQWLREDPELVGQLLSPAPLDKPTEGKAATARYLLRKFPASSYAPYARLLAARFEYLRAADQFTKERRANAISHLEATQKVDWPYQPSVLCCLRKLSPDSAPGAEALLKERYSDAVEWLEDMAQMGHSLEEWRAFRKGKRLDGK